MPEYYSPNDKAVVLIEETANNLENALRLRGTPVEWVRACDSYAWCKANIDDDVTVDQFFDKCIADVQSGHADSGWTYVMLTNNPKIYPEGRLKLIKVLSTIQLIMFGMAVRYLTKEERAHICESCDRDWADMPEDYREWVKRLAAHA